MIRGYGPNEILVSEEISMHRGTDMIDEHEGEHIEDQFGHTGVPLVGEQQNIKGHMEKVIVTLETGGELRLSLDKARHVAFYLAIGFLDEVRYAEEGEPADLQVRINEELTGVGWDFFFVAYK